MKSPLVTKSAGEADWSATGCGDDALQIDMEALGQS
jgi:hypothetical protein